MKSPKSRSRGKNHRNRSFGNVMNRVFDSSGPEGKVRGTPQQIIEKYSQLHRDALLSNDRVAAENFQQHAEHYTRLLIEAQRENEQRREQYERENAERRRDQRPKTEPQQSAGQVELIATDQAKPDESAANSDKPEPAQEEPITERRSPHSRTHSSRRRASSERSGSKKTQASEKSEAKSTVLDETAPFPDDVAAS